MPGPRTAASNSNSPSVDRVRAAGAHGRTAKAARVFRECRGFPKSLDLTNASRGQEVFACMSRALGMDLLVLDCPQASTSDSACESPSSRPGAPRFKSVCRSAARRSIAVPAGPRISEVSGEPLKSAQAAKPVVRTEPRPLARRLRISPSRSPKRGERFHHRASLPGRSPGSASPSASPWIAAAVRPPQGP